MAGEGNKELKPVASERFRVGGLEPWREAQADFG
jgi:hypothetical protein